MSSREISLEGAIPQSNTVTRRQGRPAAWWALALGLLTAASILFLIYQVNRAVQYRIEATEAWSASQVRIVQASVEEDPNLKKQYSEEQEVLRQHSQDLKQKSSDAGAAVRISAYAALLLLLGATTAVIALAADRRQRNYAD